MIALEGLSDRISRGELLSEADARTILSTTDLIAVGMLGDGVRRRIHGSRTTFVRVFEAHVNAPPNRLPSGLQAGEYRIVGAPANGDAAVAAVRAAASLETGAPILGFSLADLRALVDSTAALEELCRSLRDAGLAGVAEAPIDRLEDAASWVGAARRAGLAVARLTVGAMGDDERILLVTRARDLQNAAGGFRAFAPLPSTVSPALPTTGYDDVKQVALARLVVTNIPSIQVDWRLYGPKLAQVALTVGADDVDGVEGVEESALGTRRSAIAEIRGNIRAASLEPVERDGIFRVKD